MKKEIYKYTAIFIFGLLVGFKIIPSILLEIILILWTVNILFDALKYDLSIAINKLPYLLLIEPYSRVYLLNIPFLFMQYIIIFIYILFQLNSNEKIRKTYPWLFLFSVTILFEILNSMRTIDFRFTRSVLVNSLALFSCVSLGRQYLLSNDKLFKLFKNLSYAGLMLTGVIAVAHFQGEINYNTESNFESSNGMPPVQLSFYLSFTIVVTYIIYLKYNLLKSSVLYLSIMSIEIVIMILTFSRGGLYFFGAIFLILNIENLRKLKFNFSLILGMIFFLVIGNYIYNFIVIETDGAVIDRYNEEGVSNRDVLVDVGINIFKDNPIFGIGTGNFNMVAMDQKYFGEISGAHNEFVRVLAEHGIICFIFYVFFFISLTLHVWNNKSRLTYFIIPIILILAFNFGSIHNGLKLSLQSFALFISIAYVNNSIVNLKSNRIGEK